MHNKAAVALLVLLMAAEFINILIQNQTIRFLLMNQLSEHYGIIPVKPEKHLSMKLFT